MKATWRVVPRRHVFSDSVDVYEVCAHTEDGRFCLAPVSGDMYEAAFKNDPVALRELLGYLVERMTYKLEAL